ncbi:hypothetical protein V8E53_000571 [Lactarius tabidus]
MNTPFPTSEALTRSVFLANSSPTDRDGIERVKPLLMDYLAVVQLRGQKDSENTSVTLLKAGEIPDLPQVPVPAPATKAIKTLILLSVDSKGKIDNVGQSHNRGGLSAALLKVLDPELDLAFNTADRITSRPVTDIVRLHIQFPRHISPPLFYRCGTGIQGPTLKRLSSRCSNQLLAAHKRRDPFTAPWEASKALVDCNKDGDTGSNPIVEADELKKILRLSCYGDEDRELEPRRGVIWALMVSRMGQGDLPSRATTPSVGHLELSGSLGEVIKESAELALSWGSSLVRVHCKSRLLYSI